MKRILVATANEHKMEEIRAMLSGIGIDVVSMKEAGLVPDHRGGRDDLCGKCPD